MARSFSTSPFAGIGIIICTIPIARGPILAYPFLAKSAFGHILIRRRPDVLGAVQRPRRQTNRVIEGLEWPAIFLSGELEPHMILVGGFAMQASSICFVPMQQVLVIVFPA